MTAKTSRADVFKAADPDELKVLPKQENWVVVAQESALEGALALQCCIPIVIARLLICRGFNTAYAVQNFLQPSLAQMHDPYAMLGMRVAVSRLTAALAAGEPVLIYGDYDADGTIATVLLKTALERVAAAMGKVADIRYHIPHRIREGYGMQDARIEAAADEGVRLVVSVDTGIRAFAAAEEAARVGVDLIVTDHHLPDAADGVPEALAVLNPNQVDCPYPYKGLCGAGVAFKLAQALLEATAANEVERVRLREKTLPSFLKLLAIATIADAVPLTGENRVIVSRGLTELRNPSQQGLRALLELAQIDTTRPISTSDIGFRLAPRINAAGRMDIASDVVEMFLTNDASLARTLAEKLHRLNDERRAAEAEALRAIEDQIESTMQDLPACMVLDDAGGGLGWHRGVIGILASRVVERTGKPALVLTHELGQAHGSGRSIKGFHLLDALTTAHVEGNEPLFSRFGGHAHAVGFSLPSAHVGELRDRLVRIAGAHHDGMQGICDLECDAEIKLGDLTADFLSALEKLGPFGNGNEEPIFVSRNVKLASALKIVKERHIRLTVEDETGSIRFSGMAWSRRADWAQAAQTEGWKQGDRMDLAYRLRRNWRPDFAGWELEIVAIGSSVAQSK